ncbi:hypothetical protein EVAR_86794_1 [Eumeta japonica]|uniref:Uncharacterized protein n=1 Tax=Eumeta variegata TaxID=151549 RepID=A0A4C1VV98_EUMVA|nr:hypothetical protein EVAR_86794_1 [Eumeta japonica]
MDQREGLEVRVPRSDPQSETKVMRKGVLLQWVDCSPIRRLTASTSCAGAASFTFAFPCQGRRPSVESSFFIIGHWIEGVACTVDLINKFRNSYGAIRGSTTTAPVNGVWGGRRGQPAPGATRSGVTPEFIRPQILIDEKCTTKYKTLFIVRGFLRLNSFDFEGVTSNPPRVAPRLITPPCPTGHIVGVAFARTAFKLSAAPGHRRKCRPNNKILFKVIVLISYFSPKKQQSSKTH